jgi:uncharacterized membrane protein YdfJ with MMPL/SSD domain
VIGGPLSRDVLERLVAVSSCPLVSRHRLAVALAWVSLLLALGAGVGAAGSNLGNSPSAQNTDSVIGLGVGIDYAPFVVNRHRGNLMTGVGVADSIAKTLNTSGRAVVFAGLTAVVALLGMLTLNVGIINGMAVNAAITVVLTVLAAVTLLPALLGMIGPRVLSRGERRQLSGVAGAFAARTGW